MQIVSEALFEKLSENPLLHTSTHNRIAFVTSTHLIVRQITLEAKRHNLKLKGHQVTCISLENSNFIVILYAGGFVQVRKIDFLAQVVVSCKVTLDKQIPHRLRVSAQAVYVLGKDCVESISLVREKGRSKIYLQEAKQQPKDLLISSIFEQQIILIQYPSSIALTTEGKNIAEAPFDGVTTFKLLKDPLVLSSDSKEFLVLIESRQYLKVFDIFDMEPILEMEIFLEENEEIQLKVDPLHEYLLLRYYHKNGQQTFRNNLLKINKDFYQGSAKEPFFLFDIEIGLKQDFILFPTHIELIKGTQFYSIDMCFFKQKQIRIATLVVDVSYRTKLVNAKYINSSWKSHSSWSDFFFSKNQEEGERKPSQIQYKQGYKEDDWQIFLEKFYQENLQKLKCQGIYKVNSKNPLQYQDALNTLSGSSSFQSLKEIPTQLALPFNRRHFQEGDKLSQGDGRKTKKEEKKEKKSSDSAQSQRDQYLKLVEGQVLEVMIPVDEKIQEMNEKCDRFENVHSRKLKNIEKEIKRHRKQTKQIDKDISKWCEQEFTQFGVSLKDTLKEYSSMIGRLEISQLRSVKRLKKHYRDCLQLEVERCYQKLEEGEKTVVDIQRIANKNSKR